METAKVETKKCVKCGEEKDESEFHPSVKSKGGLQAYCKKCDVYYQRLHRAIKRPPPKEPKPKVKRRPHTTADDVVAIEEAQQYAADNPISEEEVKDARKKPFLPPRRPRSPDRTKIRNRKKPQTTQLTKKDFYYKGFFLDTYRSLAALGLSDTTIARLGGKNTLTFKDRVEQDVDTDIVYQEAMIELEFRLSHLLLVMAKGYNIEEEKIKHLKSKKTGNWVEVEKTVTKKFHPGDIQALILYLTNRFPDKWKVSRELITGKTQTYDSNPSTRDRKAIASYSQDVLEQNPDEPSGEHPVQTGLARVSGGSDQSGKE